MPKSCYCGANNFKTLYAKDVLYGAKNTFEYDVCKKCNSYYLKTKITNNNYDNNYYSLVSKKSHVHIDVLRRLRYRSYLGSIINFFKPITTYNNYVIKYLKNNHLEDIDLKEHHRIKYYVNFSVDDLLDNKTNQDPEPYGLYKIDDINNIDQKMIIKKFPEINPKFILIQHAK